MMKPAVFFDRDGVLNREVHYLYKIEDFCWMDGAIEAIRYCNQRGWYVFVVTNQSGIARGYYTEADVQRLHQWMNIELAKENAHIDDFFYCPHHAKGTVAEYSLDCDCRKPGIGMIKQAMQTYEVDLQHSILIGDKLSDVECAKNAGMQGIIFKGGNLLKLVQGVLEK